MQREERASTRRYQINIKMSTEFYCTEKEMSPVNGGIFQDREDKSSGKRLTRNNPSPLYNQFFYITRISDLPHDFSLASITIFTVRSINA